MCFLDELGPDPVAEQLTGMETDLTYIQGELDDLKSEVNGPLADRLEGIEARIRFIFDALYELTDDPGNPFAASSYARTALSKIPEYPTAPYTEARAKVAA